MCQPFDHVAAFWVILSVVGSLGLLASCFLADWLGAGWLAGRLAGRRP